jgi:undecaprenol kinase
MKKTNNGEGPKRSQARSIAKSMGNALNGIFQVFKSERNFQMHCLAVLIVVLLGILLKWEYTKWCFAILTMVVVLGAEMTNTAIEYTWDHLEPNHHPVVGIIKDVMAGVVLVVSIGAAIIGILLIFS